MSLRPLKLDVLWLFALGSSAAFAYFLANQRWVFAAALAGLLVVALIVLMMPNLLAMIWIAGAPSVFVLINIQLQSIPAVTVERAIFAVLAGLLMARLIFQPNGLQRLSAIEKAMGLYLSVIVVSWITTFGDKRPSDLTLDVYLLVEGFLMPFTAFIIARNIDWREETVRLFLWCLLAAGLFQAGAGILQYFAGWQIALNPGEFLEYPDRMIGTHGNSLPFGITIAIVFFSAMFLLTHSRDPAQRALLVGIVLVLSLCILFSKGRAVWLAVSFSLLLVAWFSLRIRPWIIGGGLLGLAILPFVAPFVLDFEDLGARLGDSSPVFNRIALYATALNMIAARPLFGFGFGMQTFNQNKVPFYDSFGSVPADYASWPAVPHNEFIHVMVLMGVPGLVAYLILIWAVVSMLLRAVSWHRDRDPFFGDFCVTVLAALAIVFLNQLFIDMMFNTAITCLLYFMLGIVASRVMASETPERPPNR